jgi:acyl-CoA reductase-like NAD-dependent aldehyde dehydrogenase
VQDGLYIDGAKLRYGDGGVLMAADDSGSAVVKTPVAQVSQSFLDGLRHSWINGKLLPWDANPLGQIEPHRGIPTGQTDNAGEETVEAAVHSARAAFDTWRRLPAAERQRLLQSFADRIESSADVLAALEALEVGRPTSDAKGLILAGAAFVRTHAALIDLVGGDVVGADDKRLSVVWRRPRGVVLVITPWNVPVTNVLARAVPALAAGNAVIVKPSENCPRSAVLLAKLASEAGIPHGVFNVVLGDGANAGRLLASHDGVDMIGFTGSSATGREIVRLSAARSLKPVLLECGGKSPSILLDDIFGHRELWAAVFAATFWNTGQLCVARTRVLVPRHRLDEAVAGLTGAATEWPCGDPFNPVTRLGPLANRRQLRQVSRFVEEASSTGKLTELRCPDSGIHPDGCFMPPYVVTDLERSSRIWQEEIFGPLAVLQPFDGLDEAIALANDTRYGLAATVWTNHSRAAFQLARSVEAGIIEICSSPENAPAWSTLQYFEPLKQSGLGVDGGIQGIRAYMAAQSVSFSH